MAGSKIVVVGSANADLVLDIDHRPAAGETVLGSDLVVTPGGKGANQAVAAGRLGGDVAFVGRVGEDAYGQMLRRSLAGAGVDVTHLRTVDAPSGNAIILITPDGENSIIVSPAANRHVSVEAVEEARPAWEGARVVVLQLEIPLETVAHVATGAAAAGARVMVNAAPAAALPPEVLAVADPLVVNESEAAFLLGQARGGGAAGDGEGPTPAGTPPPETTARALLDLGARAVVLTLGGDGAAYLERDASFGHVPARKVSAVDTTGAGDAFVGALAVELAAGADLRSAVELATDVAGIAVARRGAQASYPERSEVPR
ncbi:ribokinase [Georgenia yuyongxinii]